MVTKVKKLVVKFFVFVLTTVPILAVIITLFVAPLRADQTALNDPAGWETVFGDGWSADSTELLPETISVWTTPIPNDCAVQFRSPNRKAVRTWTVDGVALDSSGLSVSDYLKQGPSYYHETNLLWVSSIIDDGSFSNFDPSGFAPRGWSDTIDIWGNTWSRSHFNSEGPLSFFIADDGYLYYSENNWHKFPTEGRNPTDSEQAVRVSKATGTKPNPRVYIGVANPSNDTNRSIESNFFTLHYPNDCGAELDNDGDGTLNWDDLEWLNPNFPTLTVPSETVVCSENLDVCIDWSDCDTDFDNDGVLNCNDYSVSDPSIWEACQINNSCGGEDGATTQLGDLDSELIDRDDEIVGCSEQEECGELNEEQNPDSGNENTEQPSDETLTEEPPDQASKEIGQLEESSENEDNSEPRNSEVSRIETINGREVRVFSNGIEIVIGATGDEDVYVEGTTLNVFLNDELEISGSGFLPESAVEIYVYSDPDLLGSLTTDAMGTFSSVLPLPTDIDPGLHRVEILGKGPNNTERKIDYSFKLVDKDNPDLFQRKGMFEDPEGSAKTIGGLAAVAAAVAAAGATGAAAGGTAGGTTGGSTPAAAHRIAITAARSTSARLNSDSSSEDVTDDEIESLETSHDTFLSEDEAWGDKLPLWRVKSMTWLDLWWPKATLRTASISPFVSKALNDGSYLRSGMGTLWSFLPMLSTIFSFWGLVSSVGPAGEPGTKGLIGVMIIGVIDIFSGLVGATILILGFLLLEAASNDLGAIADIRFMFGLFSLACGPAILATSIRTIRKPAAHERNDWWDRIVDLTVGTFIAGWMTLILIAVLNQYANIGLKVETMDNKVATFIALAFIGRVVLEEIVARNFTGRLNRLNPTVVPDQHSGAKWTAIAARAAITAFLSIAFIGNCWQLWVGVFLFSLPSIIDEFQDRFPSRPKINRYIPQQTPTLTIVEIFIVAILGILLATIGSGPSMIRTGFMLFAIPPIFLAVTNAIGRETVDGKGTWYLEPQFTRWYRLGGVAVLATLIYLSEMFGNYLPLFI